MSGCQHPSRDFWGQDCGDCSYCIAKAAREDVREAFARVEAKLDEILSGITLAAQKENGNANR